MDEIRKYLLEASFAANDDSELPEVSDVSKILVRGEGVVHQDVQLGQVLQTVGGLKDLEDGGVQLLVVVQGLAGLVVVKLREFGSLLNSLFSLHTYILIITSVCVLFTGQIQKFDFEVQCAHIQSHF